MTAVVGSLSTGLPRACVKNVALGAAARLEGNRVTVDADDALRVAAVCLFDTPGALRVVRKRGTAPFMRPGG